jgi:exopolysaccharide biosynthesis polyprenyl glycosylphosphotransferase
MTRPGASPGEAPWSRAYGRRLIMTDVVVVAVAVLGSQLIWFRSVNTALHLGDEGPFAVTYTVVSLLLIACWLLLLRISETRDPRVVGSGTLEYKRVSDSTLSLFGLFAIVAYLGKIELGRGYLLTALPIGLFLLLLSRWLWRQWLHKKRRGGEYVSRALVIGSRAKVEHVVRSIRTERAAGLMVVGVLIPRGKAGEVFAGAEVLGDLQHVDRALGAADIETIVLTDSDDLPHSAVRALSWDLEASGVSLIVVPSLTDVAGPRIHTRPVSGLPLIHVEFPTFTGRRQAMKRAFDIVTAFFSLFVLTPFYIVIALAILFSSGAPVIFRQDRVGLNGRVFRMMKFRTMSVDAETQLESLLDRSEGSGVLFKLRDDPRVTKVGRILRRYSLDELPQLVNILKGDMSLVGPRPPLATEVAKYDDVTRRRLLVKPGLTGLWQVSGRSNLSWEDSVRLDLYYVENWSLTGDLIILYRTVRSVLTADGAY